MIQAEGERVKRQKKWIAVPMLILVLAIMVMKTDSAWAAQADMDTLVSASAEILYNNEGNYASVNPNDNGAVSIGKLQWHGWRALSLLQTIVKADEAKAKKLLGNALYNEVVKTTDTSQWSTRKFSSAEAAAVKDLLATNQSKSAQDALAIKDITSYIEQGQRLGITNEPALVYFSDLANQGGSGAAGRVASSASKIAGNYANVTLNELHEAAICDSVMGKSAYHKRRFATYKYAADLGWAYCNAEDSYIPYDYDSAKEMGAAWLQRALNACMDADLDVSGTYDEKTKEAVSSFQGAKKLEEDGYAGKNTIVALIKAFVNDEKVKPSGNNVKPSDPGDTPQQPEPPSTEQPLNKTVLKASKTSYGVNDTHEAFKLVVTSNHEKAPIVYKSSDTSVAKVDGNGKVTVKGAGSAKITASQAETGDYQEASITISVSVYATDPSAYALPTGALYAGKNMKKPHVQWLQAALLSLGQGNITVNGAWSGTMTRLVKEFQAHCGLAADGVAGDITQDAVKRLLAVKGKKPVARIKCSSKANTLTWDKYTKANRVYVYRKKKGGTYVRLKTIKDMSRTSYVDTTAKKGATYYYVVKYGCILHKMKVASPSSKGVKGVRK